MIDIQLFKKQNNTLIALMFTYKNGLLPFSTPQKSAKNNPA